MDQQKYTSLACSAQLVSALNELLLWLSWMNYVKIGTHCEAYYLAQHGETRNYELEAELKMDASQTVKELSCWVLTWLCAS